MKKLVSGFFVIIAIFFITNTVFAQDVINLYLFYGEECPHCQKEEVFLDQLERENKNIKVYRYEIWHDRNNAQILANIAKELDINVSGVPVLIVGDETISGYYNDETTGRKIKELIAKYTSSGCTDRVAELLGKTIPAKSCVHGCDLTDEECKHDCGCSVDFVKAAPNTPETIIIPFIGEIAIKDFSLPLLTLLIAGVDGFNPCSMWVLLFLISLLLSMNDRKKMWILGSAFIISSAFVYFLFLSAWLHLFLFLGFLLWVRIGISVVAVASGTYHLYDAWKNRDGGCHVAGSEKRKKLFDKLRDLVLKSKFWIALGGIVLLAFAVNLVELVCSAGLPAVYTQVLALSDLSTWQHYGYLFLYILIFMLDDIIVFLIAMTTLRMKALSSRYTKYAGVIGGVVMILIGLLLFFKPEWLMFG